MKFLLINTENAFFLNNNLLTEISCLGFMICIHKSLLYLILEPHLKAKELTSTYEDPFSKGFVYLLLKGELNRFNIVS